MTEPTAASVTEGSRPAAPPAVPGGRWRRLTDGINGLVDRADDFQQRHRVTAVPGAVLRKYSDDRAGQLAAQISHAGFLSVFPLLLVLLTVLGIVLHGHQGLQDDIINSALRQFPVVGPDLTNNIHQLSTTNTVALVVGVIWLLYGSMKLSRSAQAMMAVVWGVDRDELPDFWHWVPRAVGFLAVLGVGFIAGGALAGLGAFGRLGAASSWVGLAASAGVNIVMYWAAYAVVLRIPRGDRTVWPGAVIGGVGWTILQFAGAQLVRHQLRHLSNLYGTFATVLGLIWWMALGAVISVAAAEFNVVLNRHLWPRSIRRRRGSAADADAGADTAAHAGSSGHPGDPQSS